MVRTNQSGSIVSFIVVAALLVLGTAGLLYWIKRSDAPHSTTPGVAISGPSSDKQSPGTDTQKADKNMSTVSPSTEISRSSNQKKATSQEQTTTTRTPASNSEGSESSSQPVTQLSQTGPADNVVQIVMVGILAFAVAAYLQSLKNDTLSRQSSL